MTSFYKLFDYSTDEWLAKRDKLNSCDLTKLEDIKELISQIAEFSKYDNIELKSLDTLVESSYDETELVNLFKQIVKNALNLEILFPNGKIKRLNEINKNVELNRSQILCLLCHMTLCTLKKSRQTLYWVTFENWLSDGRCCALTYLKILFEYFRQTFSIQNLESNEFMKESITFERNTSSLEEVITLINQSNETKLANIDLSLNGSIGDKNDSAEIGFANCDIGFGISGTQEEILFGASPELCPAMLFCDTLNSNEAICITGARKVAVLNGYGLNISVKSFVDLNDQNSWKDRKIVAIDAIDFSDDYENALKNQLDPVNLQRELVKAYCGFSMVKNYKISTGFWGCGAFGGNKQLKALIQMIAASISNNELIFYCYSDREFYESYSKFLNEIYEKKLSSLKLWYLIINLRNNYKMLKNENIFDFIIENI